MLRPATLFRIDVIGAAVSCLALGLLLPQLQPHIGMPAQALHVLAAIPIAFVVYDLACLATRRAERAAWLRPIALANLGYCAISAGFLVRHRDELAPLGWAYFVIEIAIVLALATVELRAARPDRAA